jgi:hypothetical protein
MYDGIFFINHALNVKQLSVFDNRQRFEQTLETLDSIDKHCPNNVKIIFDQSPYDVDESYLRTIGEWKNTWFLDMGKHQGVQLLSLNGQRSNAECYAFMGFLEWFKQQDFISKRIYKLSGRYTLTENFILDDPSYKNAFVFATALDSWMAKQIQDQAKVDKLFRLRLWHMDYSLLDTFDKELPNIFKDCADYGIDVEHSYYKHLHKYKTIEVDKIGVKGIIAPSGEHINE